MSSRRRAGLSEGKGAVPVDLHLKTFLTHRYIDLLRGILPTCDRAEQGYAQHASRAELLFMRFQGGYDMVAFHGTNLAQLPVRGQPPAVKNRRCGSVAGSH